MKKIITFVALIALTATATAQNESMGFGIRGGGSITGYNGKTEANFNLGLANLLKEDPRHSSDYLRTRSILVGVGYRFN